MILLFISVILILALFAINLSGKSGIPSLLLFLMLGIICNFLGIKFSNFDFADGFATFALIVIMFYGGFGTSWKMGKSVVKEAAVLASFGVFSTSLITGGFIYLVFKIPFYESMLIGSIVGSTDFASVSNILKSKNLNLKYNTASLLEIESGSNDPSAYTMTMVFLSIVMGKKVSIPIMMMLQLGLGLLFGFLLAIIVSKLLEKINFKKDGIFIIFILSMMIFTYSVTDIFSGNGYLAVYIFGIIIGNQHFIGKRDVIFFYDGFSELMNIGLFFLLGLLANPENIIRALPMSFIIMLFMSFISRPVTVFGLMLPFKLDKNQLLVISWAGLRGAAAIAFAIMVVNSGFTFSVDIYHIVFGICLISSFIQASLMAPLCVKLNMLDPSDTVLNTFNFYSDKSAINFLKTTIKDDSHLVNTKVKELNLEFDFIVAKIERDGVTIVPRGDVTLEKGDTIVLAGEQYFNPYGQEILEFNVNSHHEWVGKKIMDLNLSEDKLIITINRKNGFVIAEGKTIIEEGDRIFLVTDEKVDFNKSHPKKIFKKIKN